MGEEAAVVATELQKRFADFSAVSGITFRVERGACFGFLGPNGAGKTSTLRMIQAVSAPSAGSLRVLGLDPLHEGRSIRGRIGVVPQEDNLDPDLDVRENLTVYARYFGLGAKAARARADELLSFVELTDKAERNVRELSGGMKRRLVIARSLVNEPELVILDEPTTGLDPQARHLVWRKLRELRERKVTLVLTTHYMDEAERLCDELVVMDRGKIIAEGSPAKLIAEHVGAEVVELRLADDADELASGPDVEGIETERVGDTRLFFFRERSSRVDRLVERARRDAVACYVRRATLEDVFLRLTGRGLSE